jgi:small subunit ribosomal protein S2
MLMGKTKKEVLTLQREKDKLAANLDGIKNMGGLPDMLFIIDVKQEKTAIQEAKRLGIAVAAIVDTNASPDEIDYIVPGNDDAMRSIRFYCKTIADVIIESRRSILEEEANREKEKAERAKAKTPAKTADVKTAKKVGKKAAEGEVVSEEVIVVEEVVAEAKPAAKKPAAKKSTEAKK